MRQKMQFESNPDPFLVRAAGILNSVERARKMPELPEVETVRRNLNDLLQNVVIRDVVLGDFTGCIAYPSPDEFVERLRGQRIVSAGRRGKNLLIQLQSGDAITVHLRMTGSLEVTRADLPAGKHHHLTFVLDGDRELRFSDTRKFGRLRLLTPDETSDFLSAIGPEPIDLDMTPDRFFDLVQSRSRAIKPLLMDQAFLSGVGNIYADEALWAAKIHPLRAANSLTRDEASRLLGALQAVLTRAIDRGGTTIRDYRNGLGEPGGNQEYLRIYQLNEGDPCPRCGTEILRIVVAQRGTRFCPHCQPVPEKTAS